MNIELKEVIDRLFEINDEIRDLFEKESKRGKGWGTLI
jgi:hypothetical protein